MSNLDLTGLPEKTLNERAAYIVQHADRIAVRVKLHGGTQTSYLADLPARVAIREAFRLLTRADVAIAVSASGDEETLG